MRADPENEKRRPGQGAADLKNTDRNSLEYLPASTGNQAVAALANAQLVPIPPGEKAPRCKGWPDIRLSQDDLQRHLDRGGNVAARLGRASGDLDDVDLDCAEALTLADLYLPPTGAKFG